MREIKFRAWDKKNRYMITFSKGFTEISFFLNEVYQEDGRTEDDFDWMQFTGLHDKNGKECFEGDIIDHYGEVFEVVWDEAGMWIAKGISSRIDPHTGDDYQISDNILSERIKFAEIVGNIYEN